MKTSLLNTMFFIGFILLALAGCNDSKDGPKEPAIPESPIMSAETKAKVGETVEGTLIIKNPFDVDAETHILKNSKNMYNNSISINSASCGNFSEYGKLDTTLKANEECKITYTFSPTSLITSNVELNVNFIRTDMCPNPSLDKQASAKYNITAYAINSREEKSPEIESLDLGMYDYVYKDDDEPQNSKVVGGNITFKNVILKADKGDKFTVKGIDNLLLSSNDKNCKFNSSNSILEVVNGSYCSIQIKVGDKTNYIIKDSLIFENQNKEKLSYSFMVTSDTKYRYKTYSKSPYIGVFTVVDAPQLNNTASFDVYGINSNDNNLAFDIKGEGREKLALTGTPVDGCKVEGDKIVNPTVNQKGCYITVLLRTNELGDYRATLNISGKGEVALLGSVFNLNSMVCKPN